MKKALSTIALLLMPVCVNAEFTGSDVAQYQSVTCPAGAGVAAVTITPTEGYVEVTNADADGCNITMGESLAHAGDKVTICVISNAGTTVNFADAAGVSESAGTFGAAVEDCITFIYGNAGTWREAGRSNN